MDVNFELYKVFYYVARTLSFSEAANSLFITQSAVSQAIKTLEGKMGCPLFVRSTKKVRLTKEGTILFQYVDQAFNFIKSGEKNLMALHGLEQGEVRIAASDTICKYYLLKYFHRFHVLYPGIDIRVINRPSPRCVELLKQGQFDISIVNVAKSMMDPKILIQPFRQIEDVLIAGKRFKELADGSHDLRFLLDNYPIMLLEERSTTRAFFDEWIGELGLQVKPEIELGSIDLLVEMSKIGLGLSYVMKDAALSAIQDEEVFIVDTVEKSAIRQIGIVTHKNVPLSLATQKMVELLLEKE